MIKKLFIMLLLMGSIGHGSYGDSLFNQESAKKGTLVASKNRFEVGDIITVTVKETINSTVQANTNTKKESKVNSKAPETTNDFATSTTKSGGLLGLSSHVLPNWDINSKNEHKTTGNTVRTAQLETTVTCLVKEVLDNGNLIIAGDRNLSMNREDCRLQVSGVVRARDVTPANTVASTQIANASIILRGSGPLWNNQRRGLVTKVLDWFSPF